MIIIKKVRIIIICLCLFFKKICQCVIEGETLRQLDDEIIGILYELESYFPPSFFDIIIHLTLHLEREAQFCDPVNFRWMYPFERYMETLKGYIKNYARSKGYIAESYLAEELMRI